MDLTASVAIIDSGKVLLTKREDFEVWCLPSGQVEPKETVAQAAIREAREETGLEVELTRLVGIYSMPNWIAGGSHVVLFAAKPIGGVLHPQEGEVLEACYFGSQELPKPLIWWHRQRILDALNEVGGSVAWSQKVFWPFEPEITRQALYELRDQSETSRQGFHQQYFGRTWSEQEEQLEVG